MKSKKIIVVIIILLVLLLMVGGAFAYVYVATDIFRTDKEMFLTYFAQITSDDGFIDKRINEFYKKKTQNAYENLGEITVEAEYPDEDFDKVIDKVNDLAIRFSGKVDTINQKVEQNIEVDYGNDVILPINYKQDGNAIGLQTDELSKKYIAVRNENLKQLATNLGVEDVLEIPDTIELTEATEGISFTTEEIEQLKQIYTPILQENLLEENFSSIKTEQNESYTLELNNEQIKNIAIKMLEATKQNTLIIDKINEIILAQDSEAEKIDVTVIDEIIKDINGEDIEDIPNLKLTLIQSNKILNEIIIQSGEGTISIKKSIDTNQLNYSVNCEIKESESESQSSSIFENELSEPGQANILFDVQYTGLDTLTNVQENYKFVFDITKSGETMKYEYGINTNTEFLDIVSIDELDKSVAIFLNDYNETQLTPFLTQVGNKLLEINKNQMEKLGLEEYENPILYSNPLTTIVGGLIVYNMAAETIESVDFSAQEITAHNDKFTRYEGEESRGSEVNAMIKTVQNSNLSSEGSEVPFVKVTLDGTEISESVDSSKTYNIEAIYDTEGYVTEMKVTTNN